MRAFTFNENAPAPVKREGVFDSILDQKDGSNDQILRFDSEFKPHV